MQNILLAVAFAWCLGLMSLVHAQDNCPTPVGFVCDRAQITQYRLSLDLNSQQLRSRYDDKSSIDRAEAEIAVEQYRRELNELRACQRTLGQPLISCNLSLHIKNPIGGKFFLRETVFDVSESAGECVRWERSRQQDLMDDQGKFIASSLNGHWSFQRVSPTCGSNGATGTSTSRNFSLRGYEPGFPTSKGYFQVIDWADSETYDYKVSQQWARQIQMGTRTTLAVRGEGNLVKFEFSNGAYLSLNGDSESIVDSNFLSQDHFTSAQCRTNETQSGSGTPQSRARFSPRLNLSVPYNNLPVQTIRS
ncbi:MAG: hypothetical protein A2X86_13080 [Bdellovibrionales bacterium GWA2_49_15]|nr:MAG: hypothetical protein A2X86_13080 [Bdellovibrionales bacterium GWA2_49_15]HAZ13456.1 hypothetical protein [Bdellovibrionales bacterium]